MTRIPPFLPPPPRPARFRSEFPGAFYHVMARGNRLDPIVVSPNGEDQELFLKTLGEACERTGYEPDT